MHEQLIKDSFKPLLNEVAWNVKKGHGSFLTFEFGIPSLEIDEPKIWKTLPSPLNEHPKRQAVIRGTFHLWIYCCNWNINIGSQNLAFDESTDEEIQNAANFLNGQKLTAVNIDIRNARTVFKFDLGGELLTFSETYDKGTEMWMLYMPENVLTFNNLGQFCYNTLDSTPDKDVFEQLNVQQIEINPT
jgi:hypothetical protein